MLLAHLAAVFYLGIAFMIRMPQMSSSIALILSWLPSPPNPTYQLAELQPLLYPTDLLDPGSPPSTPVLPKSKPQPVCNSSEPRLVLVHGFCLIQDRVEFDVPVHHVEPPSVDVPVHHAEPPSAPPERRRSQQLRLARSRRLYHLAANRVWFWVTMVFALAFLISSISAYPSHIAADMVNIDSNSGENVLANLTQNRLSQNGEPLQRICEVVFATQPVLPHVDSETSYGILSACCQIPKEFCICDAEGNSELPTLPPSPPSAAIVPQLSSHDATEQVNFPLTLMASVDISPPSLGTCNDRINPELSPLPIPISIVATTTLGSPKFSSVPSSPKSPPHSPVFSLASSPIISPPYSLPSPPASSIPLAEATVNNYLEDASLDMPANSPTPSDKMILLSEQEDGNRHGLVRSPTVDLTDAKASEPEAVPNRPTPTNLEVTFNDMKVESVEPELVHGESVEACTDSVKVTETEAPDVGANSRPPNTHGVFYECCALMDNNFVPQSWDTYEWSPSCTVKSRFLPRDSDCASRSSRFAVDNIDFMSCRGARSNVRFSYKPLEDALAPFEPSNLDCFNLRSDGKVLYMMLCYGIVDFPSMEQASKAFDHLQGRRVGKDETHWRLQFLNPEDETYGGRRKLVEKPPQPRQKRVLAPGAKGERRRPGGDLRAVLTATEAHNKSKATRASPA